MTEPYATIRVSPDGLLPGDEVIRVETGQVRGDRVVVYREHVDADGDPCCGYIETDCCDEPRPTCETATDGDVTVCRVGEGCDHDRYWSSYATVLTEEGPPR